MRMHPNQKRFILFLLLVISVALLAHALYPDSAVFTAFRNAGGEASLTANADISSTTAPYLSSVNAVGATSYTATQASGSITTSPFALVGNTPPPPLREKAALVADLESGTAFYSVNPDLRWPTASITKLMTATVVLDHIPTSTRITITPQMFAEDPSEQNLVIGGTYTVEDLLHLLLMPSSNVAAEAMAQFYGRSQFMSAMNARAKSWGMTNTYFDDPSGISAANESSAHDLMILAQHVYHDYPDILALTDTPQTTITELNSGRSFPVRSINVFAGESIFIGGKTGNTPQAGANLLSIFNDQGRPVLVVLLGATTLPFSDTSRLYAWFRQNYTKS